MRRKIKKICVICNKDFETFRRYKKTCGTECSNLLRSLSIKNSEKFKLAHNSVHWKEAQRQCRLGKPSPRKGKRLSKESRNKIRNDMLEQYRVNPSMRFERTKKANRLIRETRERHENAVNEEIKKFEDQSFKCVSLEHLHPDFLACKDGKIYAVEVEFGDPNYDKYNNIKFFDDIIWIRKEGRKQA